MRNRRAVATVGAVLGALLTLPGCAMPHRDLDLDASGARSPSSPGPAVQGTVPRENPTGSPSAAGDPGQHTAGTDEARTGPPERSEFTGLARAAEQAAGAPPPTPPAHGRDLIGADASWPQCPAGMGIAQKRSHGAPMPLADSAWVVLGLTNGPGFTANPCLADQVAWVRERPMLLGAYAVISQPDAAQLDRFAAAGPHDATTRTGRLRNAGYAQATFSIARMREAGMLTPGSRVPGVWLDVEPVPHFDWGSDLAANAAVVQGAARGYADAGFAVGVYSTPALWRRIVGDLHLGLPEWRAAGQTSRGEALRRCGADWVIQGGMAVMGQWVEHARDRNPLCPDAEGALADWFA